MKVYAKNPAPEDIETIENPAELVIQNPTPDKNTKTMAKRKRDSKGRYKKKRSNPSGTDEFVDTGKDLFMQYGLAALASTGTVKGAEYLLGKVPHIPVWAKEWGLIAGPAAAGILLSMFASKKSAIMQGIAGGMVLASANGLSDKLIKGVAPGGMADGAIEPGDLLVKPDGYLYDQQGNRIARISDLSKAAGVTPGQVPNALPEFSSFEGDGGHLLGDGYGSYELSWEAGEAFQA